MWDDVVAGPQPDRGLGKLRKLATFAGRETTSLQPSPSPSTKASNQSPSYPLSMVTPYLTKSTTPSAAALFTASQPFGSVYIVLLLKKEVVVTKGLFRCRAARRHPGLQRARRPRGCVKITFGGVFSILEVILQQRILDPSALIILILDHLLFMTGNILVP
ncbi:hypothetical protein E3N88_33400 [Mikania micrantha]|uniref:Uncharacterized protein n=1 Tax=Mikania micrantha TaxID=192012 RepID=A0A5N6MB63_9ASTR|nr:hypothetical protein E3N88_33400 [Mikania micrantha]